MPLNEVSEVLLDPDFATTFAVQRYTVGPDNHGRDQRTLSLTAADVPGAIYPDRGGMLARTQAGDRQSNVIKVITKYRLSDGKRGTAPDVVTWRGNNYNVMRVNDWSEYGEGFIDATAEMVAFQGAA